MAKPALENVEQSRAAWGLSDVEMANLIAQCAEARSAGDIVRRSRSSAPHVSDDEVMISCATGPPDARSDGDNCQRPGRKA